MWTEFATVPSFARRAILTVIVVLYVGFGLAYALLTPTWQAPDEPAHFNYIKHVAEGNGLPVLQMGDYDQEYLENLKAAKFPPEMAVDSLRYESHQPPLYYLLATPVYWMVSELDVSVQVTSLRIFTLLLGVPLIVLTYLIASQVFIGRHLPALAAAGFVALLPQHLAMSASVNNDLAAELVLAVFLLLLIRKLRSPNLGLSGTLALGLLLGLALLVKTTVYFAFILPPIVLLIGRAERRDYLRLGQVYGVALVVSGWWFVRNAVVYGGLDVFGWTRHDLVVAGQPSTGPFDFDVVRHFLVTTFQSFWVQLGWMGVPADRRTYLVLLVVTATIALGLAIFLWRRLRRPGEVSHVNLQVLALLSIVLVLTASAMLVYNLRYIQPQGRYLFPAIVPMGIFFALGLRELAGRLYFPIAFSTAVFLGLYLNLYSLTVLIPHLS